MIFGFDWNNMQHTCNRYNCTYCTVQHYFVGIVPVTTKTKSEGIVPVVFGNILMKNL